MLSDDSAGIDDRHRHLEEKHWLVIYEDKSGFIYSGALFRSSDCVLDGSGRKAISAKMIVNDA